MGVMKIQMCQLHFKLSCILEFPLNIRICTCESWKSCERRYLWEIKLYPLLRFFASGLCTSYLLEVFTNVSYWHKLPNNLMRWSVMLPPFIISGTVKGWRLYLISSQLVSLIKLDRCWQKTCTLETKDFIANGVAGPWTSYQFPWSPQFP